MIELVQFRVGESNYNYLLFDAQTKNAIAIDPLDAGVVLTEARKRDLRIRFILNTHGHPDHVAGNEEVCRESGASIVTGEHEDVAGASRFLRDQERWLVDALQMEVLHTPGHTRGHICLIVNEKWLIAGDTLFFAGCGNCKFGGDPDDLFQSLNRIKARSGHLQVYCGHEYATKNLEFCRKQEPENVEVERCQKKIALLMRQGKFPVSTLEEEKAYNVFLRADSRDRFKHLRQLRNSF